MFNGYRTLASIPSGLHGVVIKESAQLTMDTVSHKVCFINYCDLTNMHSTSLMSHITDSIKLWLSNLLWNIQQAERICLFKQLERVPGTRVTASIVYEAQIQYLLQQRRYLNLIPMVKLENDQKKTSDMGKWAPQPQWYSIHIHLHDTYLDMSHLQAFSQWVLVNIQLSEALEYMDDGLESLEPNTFYVPEKTNKLALDSFVDLKITYSLLEADFICLCIADQFWSWKTILKSFV